MAMEGLLLFALLFVERQIAAHCCCLLERTVPIIAESDVRKEKPPVYSFDSLELILVDQDLFFQPVTVHPNSPCVFPSFFMFPVI